MDEDGVWGMHSALGLSATEDTISAVLVDVDDDAGSVSPLEERSVQLPAVGSGAIGDAVAAAIGVMKLRAARSELPVGVVGVAYESERQRAAIERAIAGQGINGVRLVWSQSPLLDREFDVATAAAVWAAGEARAGGGFGDSAATTVVVPIPIAVPPLVSKWRNLPRSLVVATVAATVLGGSVASAIALGALGNSSERVVQVGAAPATSSAPATTTQSAVVPVTASLQSAPVVDETTVDYVPPARPQSQVEPMLPSPAPASAAVAPSAVDTDAAPVSSAPTPTPLPAVTIPSGNAAGAGSGSDSGPRATTTTTTITVTATTSPVPVTTTPIEPTTTEVEPSEPPPPGDDDDHDGHDDHDGRDGHNSP